MSRLFEAAFAVLVQLLMLSSTDSAMPTASRDSRIKHQTTSKRATTIDETLTDAFMNSNNKNNNRPEVKPVALMKKIGLEIPESTRKDMDEPSSTGLVVHSSFKSTSLRRLLTEMCISGVVDSNGVTKVCNEPPDCTEYHPSCTSCTVSWCTACDYGFTISLHNCTCPSPKVISGYSCITCSSPCATCSLDNVCVTCVPGYSLQGSSCVVMANVVNCASQSNGICSQCIGNYQPTSGGTVCSPCPAGTASGGGTCESCNVMCDGCSIQVSNCNNCASGYPLKLSDNSCVACPTGCTACSSSGCSSCQGGYYLNAGSCQTNCPQNYYANGGSNLCEPCDSTCSTCFGTASFQCSTCPGNYLTVAKFCKSSCESNEFADGSNVCHTCDASCLTCNAGGQGACTSCSSPNFLTSQQCVATCPGGSTPNNALRTCEACDPKCATCSAPNNGNACLTCPVGRVLGGTYCNRTCATNEYYNYDNDQCTSCNILCSSCRGPGTAQDNCTCSASAYKLPNNDCYATCPSMYYADGMNCKECNTECLSCYGPENNKCLTCDASKYRTTAKYCKSSCEANEYIVGSSNLCDTCDTNCLTCLGASTTCTDCAAGKYLLNGACLGSCPTGYYANATAKKCQACATQCETCNSPANAFDCLTCPTNRTLRGDKYCKKNCPSTQYFLDSDDSCNDCNVLCATCTGAAANTCPTCAPNAYRWLSGECVSECSEGSYPDASRMCQYCHSSCKSCNGPNATNCLSCNSTLYRTTTLECKSSCAAHQYFNATNYCFDCDASCNTCTSSSATDCLSCYPNKWFNPLAKSCGLTCPAAYLPINSSWACEACATTCQNCTVVANPYKCNACSSSRWLRPDNYCQKNCTVSPPQYFQDSNDSCYDCHPLCANCTNSTASDCPSCISSAYRTLSGVCVSICPEGTFPDANHTCQLCHNTCKSCDGPLKNNCLSCNSSIYLTVGRECKSSCDQYEWFNSNLYCFSCHDSCSSCENSSLATSCLSCFNGSWINPLNHSCGDTCPSGYIPINATWSCEKCASTCVGCSAVLDKYKCTVCDTATRYLRTDGYCQTNCSTTTPQYFVDANDSCVDCHPLCKSCANGSSPANCIDCRDNAFRDYRGDCVSVCPSDTYAATNRTCQPCNTTCLTCSGPLGNNCLTCNANLYRTASKECKSSCDPHEWYDSSKFCTKCDTSCDTCNGSQPNQCLSCYSTAYRYTVDSTCRSPCPDGFMDDNSTHVCGVCHANCKKCSFERNAYKCMSCFSDRNLRVDGYCAIPCRDGQYFDDNSDSCQPCHPYCATCGGGGLSDCINCAQGLFLSYTTLCVKSCPTDSFTNGTTCVKCHRSCSTCSGPTAMNCLTCPGTQVLTVAKACSDTCDPAEVVNSQLVCEKCHPTCSSCKSPSMDGCLACQNPEVTTLSAAGNCLNCLINPEVDPETCWYSVPLSLSKASTRGLSLQASTTIRLSFRNESLFQPKITSELLKRVLIFDVPGLSATEWVWLFRQTGGEMLIDLYFMESKLGDFKLVAKPKEQVILKNSAGIAELIFWNKTAEYEITVRKAPDAGMVEALTLASSRANSAGAVMGTVSSIMSVVAVASASGLGAPLLKILRIFKLLSRLRLINVFFGSYLEVFLQAVGRLYALGGDDINLEVAKLTPKSRGKLDMYAVSVLSADVMALKYAVYFLSLAVRIYRAKIRGYALQKGSLSVVDAILDSVGERCKTMLLVMVGIDIVFYSLRCVSHMDITGELNFIASCSFLLSIITIVVFVIEFYMLIEFNMDTSFTALRRKARMARVVLKRAEALKGGKKYPSSKEPKSTKDQPSNDDSIDGTVCLANINPLATQTETDNKKVLSQFHPYALKQGGIISKKVKEQKGTRNLKRKIGDSVLLKNKGLELITLQSVKGAGDTSHRSKSPDLKNHLKGDNQEDETMNNENNTEKLSEYLYGYRQQKRVIDNPSAEQFFGNGIKLHKLRTPEGRYYNTVALVKMFALEPLFIDLQMFSTAQIVAIYLVQLAFVVWTVRAGMMKRVFSSVIVFTALAINEIAVLVFLTVGVFFQLAGGERSVSSSTSSMVQFVAIGAIAVACVVGFLEFFVSIILAVIKGIQDRKVAVAQKAVNNHRDEMKSVRHRVIGRDLPGAEPPVPPVDADMSSSVADIKANQVGQSAKPVLGKTRLAPGKRLSRPPLQPLARK